MPRARRPDGGRPRIYATAACERRARAAAERERVELLHRAGLCPRCKTHRA